MKWLACIMLLFPCLLLAQVKPAQLQDGDLLFQDMDCGPLCDAIEAVTDGYGGRDFSHMGMVYHRNDTIYIAEAAGKAVRLTPLATFAQNTKKPMLVMRLKKEYASRIPAAIDFSLKQLGVPYDSEYVYNNGAYYCSELIYDAFLYANGNKPFFTMYPMTYKEPGTNQYFPAWVKYYKAIGKPIPEGLPGCNPGGVSKSEKLTVVGDLSL
jgi:hypothetical protein